MTTAKTNIESSNSQNWFSSWFDTSYYHILYKDRNDDEAKRFIDTITRYLNIDESGIVLDLACGKGRHSLYLNQLGYRVKGVDLSENSIQYASQFENKQLSFAVHDMRQPLTEQFDVVFNLFTSFGYFDTEEEDLQVLAAIKNAISEFGVGVIDFMNVTKAINNLVKQETKTIDQIDFNIRRSVKDGFINKEISFIDQGQSYSYTEKVKVLALKDFERLMEKAGMYIFDVFGDYQLGKFNPTESDRLILIFK